MPRWIRRKIESERKKKKTKETEKGK